MFPFHQFQAQSVSFSHSQNVPSPISDIESQSKSVNGDLCQSFEGLFSKQVEQSTMSSEWSRKGNEKAGASKLDNQEQNQCQQKKQDKESVNEKVYRNLKVFQKAHQKLKERQAELKTTTPFDDYQVQDKIQLQVSQSSTNSILQQKRNKVQKYRSQLLSQACYTKLPPSLLQLLQISTRIDNYLSSKKSSLYTENLFNIFKSLFSDEQMSTIWSNVKRLMFISKDHYKVRVDPLKNLCLGLGQGKGEARRMKMRKLMGEYYFGNRKMVDEEGVPEAYVEPIKTARFYPENLNLCPQILTGNKKVSKKYMAKLQQSVLTKQTKLQQLQKKCQAIALATPQPNNSQSLPLPDQLQQFCSAVLLIYSQRKVSHMYKSSLVQHIRKNTLFSLEKIFFFIKYITQHELFLEILLKTGCKIFAIVPNEKDQLIAGLIKKRGDQENINQY